MTDGTRRGRRKQPKQGRSKALVDAMVAATEEILRGGGSDGVSMKAIARRAGVGASSVYEYFAHQDGLIDVLLDRTAVQNFRRLEAILNEDLPIRDLCEEVARTSLHIYLDAPRMTLFMLKTAHRFDRMGWVHKERDRYAERLAARVEDAFPNAEPAVCRASTVATADVLSGIIMSALYRGKTDPSDLERALVIMMRFIDAEIAYLQAQQPSAVDALPVS